MSWTTPSLVMCLLILLGYAGIALGKHDVVVLKHSQRIRRQVSRDVSSLENLRMQLLRKIRKLRTFLHSWQNSNSEICRFHVPRLEKVDDLSFSGNDDVATIWHLNLGLTTLEQFYSECSQLNYSNDDSFVWLADFLLHLREYLQRYSQEQEQAPMVAYSNSNLQRTTSVTTLCVTNLYDYVHAVLRNEVRRTSSRRKAFKGKEIYKRYLLKCRRK